LFLVLVSFAVSCVVPSAISPSAIRHLPSAISPSRLFRVRDRVRVRDRFPPPPPI
jgi:hypothetical protein